MAEFEYSFADSSWNLWGFRWI